MKRCLWLCLLSSGVCADEENLSKITFDGQYRGRLDMYNGVNKAAYGDQSIDVKGKVRGKSNDRLYLQQLIAGFTYVPSDNWEYKLYMYDSRAWGSSLKGEDFTINAGTADAYKMDYYNDHLELFTAYVRYKNLLDSGVSLTVGRQKLGYGDRRVFGPGEWKNTMGWLWDAVHFSYKHEKNFIDGWYGQTRIISPDDFSLIEKHRYQGVGIYGHYEGDLLNIEPFAAWKNPLYHTTLPYEDFYYGGGRVYKEGSGWIVDMTGVQEIGHSGDKHVDAYGYVLKAGYQWDTRYTPKVMAGITYASGDKNPYDAQITTFTSPYGMNDGPYYGRADIVIWSNIRDVEASFSTMIVPDLRVELGCHRFNLADPNDKWYEFGYTNKPGNSYTHLGDEIDLIANYRINESFSWLGIVSYFQSGDFIRKNNIAQNNASKIFLQFEYRFATKNKNSNN